MNDDAQLEVERLRRRLADAEGRALVAEYARGMAKGLHHWLSVVGYLAEELGRGESLDATETREAFQDFAEGTERAVAAVSQFRELAHRSLRPPEPICVAEHGPRFEARLRKVFHGAGIELSVQGVRHPIVVMPWLFENLVVSLVGAVLCASEPGATAALSAFEVHDPPNHPRHWIKLEVVGTGTRKANADPHLNPTMERYLELLDGHFAARELPGASAVVEVLLPCEPTTS